MKYVKHPGIKDRGIIILIGLGYLVDGLVIALSLGCLDSEIRIWLLFKVFAD